MKNFSSNIVVSILCTVMIFISIYSLSNTDVEIVQHYKIKKLFEINLSNKNEGDQIDIDDGLQKLIVSGPSPFSPTVGQWYKVPPILHVDNNENIYLLTQGKIQVFDSLGVSVLTLDIPDENLNLDYYSWNEDGLYLFFNRNYSDTDYQIYLISVNEKTSRRIGRSDRILLETNILPPTSEKEMAQAETYKRSISNEKGIYYGIGWGNGDYNLLHNASGRYIDPKEILVYKFDESYKESYVGPISQDIIAVNLEMYNKYTYDRISIESLFDEKLVCIGPRNVYVDKNGNIFLIGIKSNEVKRIITPNKTNAGEVSNPVLFLVKLENQ